MTAEVVVVNKSAVALAADSAVTVTLPDSSGRDNDKIYNTANKLFALSKTEPVGIMVYNTMELGGVPWETIIKQYRRSRNGAFCDHLDGYAEDFFDFLSNNNVLFPEANLDQVLISILRGFFLDIKQRTKSISSREQTKVLFEDVRKKLESQNYSEGFSESDAHEIIRSKAPLIDRAAEMCFAAAHIRGLKTLYRQIAAYAVTKDIKLQGYSGVIFSGFGRNDVYPSTIDFFTDLVILGKVRRKKNSSFIPTQLEAGRVLPFAQDDITRTVLEGINPQYAQLIQSKVLDFFLNTPKSIIQSIDKLDDIEKEKYARDASQAMREAVLEFFKNMDYERLNNHTFQIETAIQMMPFSELAEVAEVFIKLTQVRQRLSPDSETVGGPIDVAVISKADGFVWIKRKLYFEKELNHSFFQKYMQE